MGQQPQRVRQLGIAPGTLPVGRTNGITDVAGLRVGHTTIVSGDDIRTGVTAVVPDQLDRRRALPAGLFVGNGHGKLVGSTQLAELGELETPIVLTATLSTFRAADALLTYMFDRPGWRQAQSINPVVGETNDGYLSDIRARPVTAEHVLSALREAAGGLPAEGAVGAGTGTAALGFKAGIGTSSRVVGMPASGPVTVGALVQANFSGVLRVAGVPIDARRVGVPVADDPTQPGNSCVIVVATDAMLDARQLTRLARRAVFAMATVGSDFAGGSGDYALAFSTADAAAPPVPDAELDGLFSAVLEAVEEALLNSLFLARTTTGYRGHVKHAVPVGRVLELVGVHSGR